MYNVAIIVTYVQSDFQSKHQSFMTMFIRGVLGCKDIRLCSTIGMDIIQNSIIHESMCKLIHKKCH